MADMEKKGKSKLSLIFLSQKNYLAGLSQVISGIDSDACVCYVCMTRPFMEVIEDFRQEGVDASHFFFIDAVSSHGIDIPPLPNCVFIPSPEIGILHKTLQRLASQRNCSFIIIDTISAILPHERFGVLQFTNYILNENKNLRSALYLLFNEPSPKKENYLIKDLEMFADKEIFID